MFLYNYKNKNEDILNSFIYGERILRLMIGGYLRTDIHKIERR